MGADEKSLNISRMLMGGRWKRVSPRGSKVVDGKQRIMKNGCAPGTYTQFFKIADNFGESQEDHLAKYREQASWFCKQKNLYLRQAGIVLKYFRPRKVGREFRIILAK